MKNAFLHFIETVYKGFISPALHVVAGPGFGCRFQPTCGAYAIEAIKVHGWWRGGRMALVRVSRCRPLGPTGYDPVPRPEKLR